MSRTWIAGAALLLLLLSGSPLAAQSGLVDPDQMPGPLKEVRFDQRLGDRLPLDARFLDEIGREVTLGDLIDDRPVILALVYYDCPMLCTLVLNGLAKSLGVLQFDVGREFDVVVVSFDPDETPRMAREREAEAIGRYGREETAGGWHFLTAPRELDGEETIRRLTEAVGFSYTFVPNGDDPEDGEFAHASGIMVVTPDGELAQYFYGIEYPPKDVRLALVEASERRIGSVVDQILLYCFRYDPQLGKYTAVVTRILRLTGIVFVVVLVAFLWIMLRRDRTIGSASTLGAPSR